MWVHSSDRPTARLSNRRSIYVSEYQGLFLVNRLNDFACNGLLVIATHQRSRIDSMSGISFDIQSKSEFFQGMPTITMDLIAVYHSNDLNHWWSKSSYHFQCELKFIQKTLNNVTSFHLIVVWWLGHISECYIQMLLFSWNNTPADFQMAQKNFNEFHYFIIF